MLYKEKKSNWEQYRKMEKKNFRNLYRESNFDAWIRECKRFVNELIEFDLDIQDIEVQTQRKDLCENKRYQQLKDKKVVASLITQRLIQEGFNALIEFQPVEGSRVTGKYIKESVNWTLSNSMR